MSNQSGVYQAVQLVVSPAACGVGLTIALDDARTKERIDQSGG